MNVSWPTIGGKLRERTSGVDRSQAGCSSWDADPIGKIGQTCGLNVILRRAPASHRGAVTAESGQSDPPAGGEDRSARRTGAGAVICPRTCFQGCA